MLIADRVCASDYLDDKLGGKGVKMVSPHRKSRTWIGKRFFAWMKCKRRLLNLLEFHPENVFGFVQISAAILRLRQS